MSMKSTVFFLALASLVQQILNQKQSGPGFQRFHRVDRITSRQNDAG